MNQVGEAAFLGHIVADKRTHIQAKKAAVPLDQLRQMAQNAPPPRGFKAALEDAKHHGRSPLIAEIKKASPSKGLIREDFDPALLAAAYEKGGATCLSVLTDMPYFQGADDHLVQARANCTLPVLRKDFMIDPYQIVESRAIGADAILLIMALLDIDQARMLESLAHEWGMDVLVEVHNAEELEKARKLSSRLLGINNRNLHTFAVDIETSRQLVSHIPDDYFIISESGIYTHEDLTHLAHHGISGFLVGESLMRRQDVTAATRMLLGLQQDQA